MEIISQPILVVGVFAEPKTMKNTFLNFEECGAMPTIICWLDASPWNETKFSKWYWVDFSFKKSACFDAARCSLWNFLVDPHLGFNGMIMQYQDHAATQSLS